MKILSAEQIRELDAYTIQHEPIAPIDLMERAATELVQALTACIRTNERVVLFCGMGNNGGDGLAVARMLVQQGYLHVSTFVVRHAPTGTPDFLINEERLKQISGIQYIETDRQVPPIPAGAVVIDALFGSGLTRPLSGISATVVNAINAAGATVYAVDVPSGMYCNQINAETDIVVKADTVFTFHAPKLTFLLPSSAAYVQQFVVLDIGLNQAFAESRLSNHLYVTRKTVQQWFKKRGRFSHKGTHGHALLCAGSQGKAGAALLAVKAALHSGAGLVTACIPPGMVNAMHTTNPEAMVYTGTQPNELSTLPALSPYNAIGAGPGIGTGGHAHHFITALIETAQAPLVLDADALNIIAENKALLKKLPKGSILTPHPGEFKRLAGNWETDLHKLQLLRNLSVENNVVVVLKGAHTCTALPAGELHFNSTGNPGMAKGGSGDVLTGVITALLAQGYTAEQAAIIGVYIHGQAGDYAAAYLSQTGMAAGDIIRYLPEAFGLFE